MKAQGHQPVNEWNSCQNPPIVEGESEWNHLEPEPLKTLVFLKSVGPEPAVIDSAYGQCGAKPPTVDGKQNALP